MKKIITTTLAVAMALTPMVPALAAQATSADPTAVQVAQGLLNVYATQQVWPKGLQTAGLIGQTSDKGDWQNGATPTPRTDWYGLSTVFPGQSASQYGQDLGMTNVPQNKPITAGTLAQWIMNWQMTARIPAEYHYLNKYQPSQDPYTLMQMYSFYYSTDFKNAKSLVTAHDLQMVEKNIQDVDQCYRQLAPNKIQLLVPFGLMFGYGRTHTLIKETQGLKEFDSITLTFPGNGTIKATTGMVYSPFAYGGQYFKNVNSGLDNSQFFTASKSGKTVTLTTNLKGKQLSKFLPSDFVGVEEIPKYIGRNNPFVTFFANVIGIANPQYYFTMNRGKLANINVYGTVDNSWPIFVANQDE